MIERLTDGRDIIDSREIEERISEIAGEAQGRHMTAMEPEGVSYGELVEESALVAVYMDVEDVEEYTALVAFRDEIAGYCPDWEYGETFIRDSYFEDYARELAEDIGAVTGSESWPLSCIDWERAARELRMDYTSGELGGVTYWGR